MKVSLTGLLLLATLSISHSTSQRRLGKEKKGRKGKGPSSPETSPALQPGDCVVCDKQNKIRPTSLSFEYIPGVGENSRFQTEDKADCRMGSFPTGTYPDSPGLSFDGQSITLDAKNEFTITSDKFDAETDFDFGGGFSCFIHTSCSQPLVVGDQFGPFKLKGSNNCGPPTDPGPGVPCDEDDCVICDRENKIRPTSLTFRFHTAGENSAHQDESKASCRARMYPAGPVTVSGKKGDVIGSFNLADGEQFTITTTEKFDAETTFTFSDNTSCFIHTSCSAPLVRGDQIGPLEILGDDAVCLPCPARPCCEVFGAYEDGKIIVDFRNQCTNPDQTAIDSEARFDDWVGLYPCNYVVDENFPSHSPQPDGLQGAWMYTCYQETTPFDDKCQNTEDVVVKQGRMVFERSTAPEYSLKISYGHLSNPQGPTNYDGNGDFPHGCYVAILNHNEGMSAPPYYIACQSNDFMVG